MKSYYGVPKPKDASLAALRQRLARLTRFHFETFPTNAQELELFLQKHWQNIGQPFSMVCITVSSSLSTTSLPRA